MMGELILRNLLHRPLRTLIGAMGIAVEVALVVLIVGLTSGLLTETAKRIEGIGADIMLLPANSSIFFAFGNSGHEGHIKRVRVKWAGFKFRVELDTDEKWMVF